VLELILYNGKLLNSADVFISPEDRGYYFGDGVYEVFRIYQGKLYQKEAHLRRLVQSAASIQLDLPYSIEEISRMVEELNRQDNVSEGTLYMQITRGIAPRAHTFPEKASPTIYAYCKQVSRPLESMRHGIRAITMDDIRWLRCDIKCLNLLPNTLAKQHAVTQGVEEAVLHRSGTVTECSASNIMIIKNNRLYTHPANHLILHGITREVVLSIANEIGLEVRESAFDTGSLYQADEVFITGTTVEITPVIEVDQKSIGNGIPGKMTMKMQQAFEQTIGK
jgi:D-alanine transaminase